ncbi:hypothetical protein D6764_02710 [Candidatus Woesearchaeota archaeon]|nr:MAG: hypothetical protein D6764_02710 [Candidatus Woesearchaeota archaeon]
MPSPINKIVRTLVPVRWLGIVESKLHSLFDFLPRSRRPERNLSFDLKLKRRFYPEVRKLDELLHSEGFLPKEKSVIKLWGYDKL